MTKKFDEKKLLNDVQRMPQVMDQDDIPDSIKLKAIKLNPECIEYVIDPTHEMMEHAVLSNPHLIYFLPEAPDDIKELAISKDGRCIQYIEDANDKMKMMAIKENPITIKLIKDPTDEMCRLAVFKDINAIVWIKNPTEEEQLRAVKKTPAFLKDIAHPSKQVQEYVIKHNPGQFIYYIQKNRYEDNWLDVAINNKDVIIKQLLNMIVNLLSDAENDIFEVKGMISTIQLFKYRDINWSELDTMLAALEVEAGNG